MDGKSLDMLVKRIQSLALIGSVVSSLSISSPASADYSRSQSKKTSINLFLTAYSLSGQPQPERPPYLDPAPGREAPSYQEPSSSSKKKKSSDYTYGTILTLVGGAMVAFGTQKMTVCVNGECKSEIPPFGYVLMFSGGMIAIDGIYLLAR